VLTNTCWGVEHLSYEERLLKALLAGVDQLGGEFRTEALLALVKSGEVTEDRVDQSVRRLLREKFRLGLFENPFVDADRAERIVGSPPLRAEGLDAQARAHTLLKNCEHGPGHLPLAAGVRVYVENLDARALEPHARIVASPEEAEVAILRLVAPWEPRGEPNSVESFFHAGSLAFPEGQLEHVRRITEKVPTVIDVYLDRPAILAPLSAMATSLIVNFGASEEALARVLFGDVEPQGRLPFDIPSSMEAVASSRPDVPFDTARPTFRFGFGLTYEGAA
jgi:beta-glucosidase